ncbi:unnamed protein product [Haemonchus placei]|uniref:Ephrin RBD domain-containing protein n=1 Tax=Haemonchus placei TaxID=6290 RepID=A0A0N4X3X3_HAEPC|nr:unnamed protein product [Haemonchus placei]
MVVEYEIFAPRYSRVMSAIDMEHCEYQADGILYCPQQEPPGTVYYVRNVYPPIQVRFTFLEFGYSANLKPETYLSGPYVQDVQPYLTISVCPLIFPKFIGNA